CRLLRRARNFLGPMLPRHRGTRPACSPIDQLDRMDRREIRARLDLRDAAEIAGRDHVRSQSLDSPDFTLAQPPCDVRLKNIVSPGRAAAKVTFGHIFHDKAELGQNLLRLPRDALSML